MWERGFTKFHLTSANSNVHPQTDQLPLTTACELNKKYSLMRSLYLINATINNSILCLSISGRQFYQTTLKTDRMIISLRLWLIQYLPDSFFLAAGTQKVNATKLLQDEQIALFISGLNICDNAMIRQLQGLVCQCLPLVCVRLCFHIFPDQARLD